MKLALIQLNPTIGDIAGNAAKIAEWSAKAERAGADLVVFPELALTGYPPRDLLLQEGFLEAVRRETIALTAKSGRATVVFGLAWKPGNGEAADSWDERARTTNALMVVRDGKAVARHDKRLLPTYDVFDEDRYFHPGERAVTVDVAGVRVGLSICEDLWRGDDAGALDRYVGMADPVDELVAAGATVIVNPSASPFVLGKGARQREILKRHVKKHGVCVAAVNQVGANDDLIFDGHACAYVPDGAGGARLVAAGNGFVEEMVLVDVGAGVKLKEVADPLLEAEEMSLLWRALVLGVRDYCEKLGFTKALLGLSGGIDSALTVCIAAAALGAGNVLGVGMPSVYSSAGSVSDAEELAKRVGLQWVVAPIGPGHEVMKKSLGPVYESIGAGGYVNDLSDENLQSRLRGVTVMAISNKTGALLLTTGNKSELAVGYCTLYGDMNGGLAVLSDVFKVDVYRLSRWLNAHFKECGFAVAPIPEASITKAPSAELRPDQTDQDSLPAYEVLDAVVERYVEKMESPARIARETGFDPALVTKIARMIDGAEFKRKQMPIGLKVSGIAFGRGRRRPIVQRFRE